MASKVSPVEAMMAQDVWYHHNGGPRYLQLQRHLEKAISSGVLEPDTPLPPEREMALIADISRVTIRKAVEKLVRDGLVVQKRGSGSFVAPRLQRMEHSLSQFTSFTEDMRRRGKNPASELISSGLVYPSPEEMVALGLASGETVARIERLRCADGVPVAIERSSVSSQILPNPDDVTGSLYETLAASGHRLVRAVQRISAAKLTAKQAGLLKTEPDAAALKIDRTAYLASGRAAEFTTGVYRGDAYDFVAELRNLS